jgi:pimeloyl-ACP methyl ester carboxylesterase
VGTHTWQLTGSWLGLPGRRLWVERAGHGPAVVFTHAAIADCRMWDGQLAALADRYQVVRYDQPGFGRSEPATEPYSYVEELDAVLDHVGAGRAVLVWSPLRTDPGVDARIRQLVVET